MAFSSELTSPEKTLVILRDVVGLDMAAYGTNLDLHNQVLDYKGLPQEDVKYILESDVSKLDVICTFVTEKLRSMNIYVTYGSPLTTQQAGGTVEMAKDFINRYQTISSASYYKTMVSMLDNVEANNNVTKTFENVKLTVTENANYTSYRWTYTVNGIEAPSKCVALKFEKGFLKYFIDNWGLYTIGSTDIKLSEEEAVRIAMDRTENHSWNVSIGDNPPVTVTEFNIVGVSETKLSFGNYATNNESRDGNPFTLYPGWRIKLYFDKLYPGSVYGVDVGIWADTGEVNDISELLFLGDYSSNPDIDSNGDSIGLKSNEGINDETSSTMPAITWASLPIAAVLVITIAYSKRKKKSRGIHNEPKSNSLKLSGALLCLLISLTMIPMVIAIPTVKAGTYVMPLYGARCNGTITEDEESAAHSVINVWESYFNTWTDYTIYDLFGSDTQKDTVLDHADIFEDYFDHVAMFHYGHAGKNFSNGHYDYFDDDGWNGTDNLIWDYEIYQKTGSSKHFFVVLWSCRQGDIVYGGQDGLGKKGMPYAWFHGYPSSGDCFIGFKNASMPLTQQSANSTWCEYDLWLKQVGIRLSYSHSTVHQALDQASNQYFDCDYDETELYLGFTAYWEGFPSGAGEMRVYGNWNIQVW